MYTYRAGIDIGSTTIKLIVLDEKDQILYGEYMRHGAHIQETLTKLLQEAYELLGACKLKIKITGSGSMSLGKALGIEFIQEVSAVAKALQHQAPQTDVAIELGGEDAKIIYFKDGLDERMNGVCAGGTGSFIDQMAALLQTDAKGLNEEAVNYKQIYSIAARCGVFAKSDIQPLINDGASKADLAASIFQAVVNQTISGLACGRPIRGCVAFLGGPLHFLPELKKAFIRTLKLTPENIVDSENSHLFAAMGAALEAGENGPRDLKSLIETLDKGVSMHFEIKRLEPLFAEETDYEIFCKRHNKNVVKKAELKSYKGNCFLGIDAGSTTTKMALIGEKGELLFSYYTNNQGNPIEAAKGGLRLLKEQIPDSAKIVRSCSTGYGENLLKSAFYLDEGEVETIAHCEAAAFFEPQVDCVLDIGGQDMKCIRLTDGVVDNIMLNEACSSGCGSFIENFAVSLGYTAPEFAKEALFARNPVDLGTRCTVFMNSNVKQAQKEGASVADISAGLAYSVIKNALFKVIKLGSAEELGKHIVVQGGTFHNRAVLRAFEKITGMHVICPDISGIMGAFGAALLARKHYLPEEAEMISYSGTKAAESVVDYSPDRIAGKSGQHSGSQTKKANMLSLDEMLLLEYSSSTVRCQGCENHCMLTINKFSGNRRHISGNRCEKGLGEKVAAKASNMVEYKRNRIFGYEPLSEAEALRGTIGIPRVLNVYENYPFWAVFWRKLGFRTVISPFSSRKIYEMGMESIPSESECYPAKLAHGHVEWLIQNGIKTIFHPCVFYERQEVEGAQNHYNCPIVISYSENLKNNVESVTLGEVKYLRPFLAFTSETTVADRMVRVCEEVWNISEKEVREAVSEAWQEQLRAKQDIRLEGKRLFEKMQKEQMGGIILTGRPYHIDPEINHGIPEMIASYGLTVFTEDSIPEEFEPKRPLRVTDQWVYHSRLYTAAEFACRYDNLELVQLNSFGCGLDAVTTDQVSEILQQNNKLYTVLKIDEVNNLGAARIRIRSLLAAMELRRNRGMKSKTEIETYQRTEFTKKMFEDNYTILAPQMSPIHFEILEPVFKKHGYNVEILDNDNRRAIDVGLQYVNNDACFPSITVVGQIMDAVLSGKYDTDKLAIMMTQTGGCCRASNYVGFIRRALEKAGLPHIPVISLNANGMEKNEGFKFTMGLLLDAAKAIVYGDLFMRCLYRVRPYESKKGSANQLHQEWKEICIDSLVNPKSKYTYKKVCQGIVNAFDTLPVWEGVKKPRVGIVGEILVKYMPLANGNLVKVLESEGAEVVVPDLMDFMNYSVYNGDYQHKFLGTHKKGAVIANWGVKAIRFLRKPAIDALDKSKRFESPMRIEKVAELAKPILSLGNQYGEGWFLTGEMAELLTMGVHNIVCIQPFACLPNHVVGKGVIKALKNEYKQANIVAVDYDPGASEVNQLNRIKLMLTTAKQNLK